MLWGTLRTVVVLCTIGIFLAAQPSWAADPFPAEALPGQAIGEGLPAGYEPSGAVLHTRLDRLMVISDSGKVSSMTSTGGDVVTWNLAGDLEGICVADPSSDFIYVGIENPDSIVEFNIVTGQATRTFDLTPWLRSVNNNQGLEALTFVPDDNNPEGGLFYAGLQATGEIYTFQMPIVSSSDSTAVTYQNTITPVVGRNDISGLNYDINQQVLYAIFDSSNMLRAMEADGTLLQEWQLPGRNQEGIALCDGVLYLSEDSGEVMRYSPFSGVPEPSTLSTLVLLMMATMVGTLFIRRR